ncbi:MAG: DUF6900 domain-containing protein [Chthoniobacteraceae bacterium]
MQTQTATAKIPAYAAKIAKEILDLETLEARNMDGLDFHELSVWEIRKALEAAYNAGRKAASQ